MQHCASLLVQHCVSLLVEHCASLLVQHCVSLLVQQHCASLLVQHCASLLVQHCASLLVQQQLAKEGPADVVVAHDDVAHFAPVHLLLVLDDELGHLLHACLLALSLMVEGTEGLLIVVDGPQQSAPLHGLLLHFLLLLALAATAAVDSIDQVIDKAHPSLLRWHVRHHDRDDPAQPMPLQALADLHHPVVPALALSGLGCPQEVVGAVHADVLPVLSGPCQL